MKRKPTEEEIDRLADQAIEDYRRDPYLSFRTIKFIEKLRRIMKR